MKSAFKRLCFTRKFWQILVLALTASVATFPGHGQVATTTVQDTVFHANGTVASGTILVTWPAFVTAQGSTVAAGNLTVPIGSDGKVTIQLAPNVGSKPAGTYYTAVYHLDNGTVSKEYWNVPNVATTTVAAIRTLVMPTSIAVQAGTSISQVNALLGSYLPLHGGTLEGSLQLAGNPQQAMQAATKQYVDQEVSSVSAATANVTAQSISKTPVASQTIQQPQGTSLSVNTFQGKFSAQAFQTDGQNNGIANLTTSADCTSTSPQGHSGCTINVDPTYGNAENPQGYGSYLYGNNGKNMPWPIDTHVHDQRNGVTADYYENPFSVVPYQSAGQNITSAITLDYQKWPAYSGTSAGTEYLQTTDFAGGINFDNYFGYHQPQYFFKPYYDNLSLATTNYTSGQQEAFMNVVNCHGTGDCLAMTTLLTCDGGMNTSNDEGCHGGDFNISEDPLVWRGVVYTAAAIGATVIHTYGTAGQRTQGQDRLLLDTNPAGIITGSSITGYAGALPTGPSGNSAVNPVSAQDSNASFPISTMVQLCYPGSDNGVGGAAGCIPGSQPTGFIPSAPHMINPAPSITTDVVASYNPVNSPQTGLPAGFCTPSTLQSTNSDGACYLPPSGVACLTDQEEYETVHYTYDSSAQQITLLDLRFPHLNGLFFAHGGLCGYAVEQQSDVFKGDGNYNGISQVFPVEGSPNSTSFYYISQRVNLGYTLPVLGVSNEINGASTTGGGECFTLNAFVFQLRPDDRTVVVATNLPFNSGNLAPINGMTLKITTDNPSYNGSYVVSWGTVVPNANEFSYVLPATPTGPVPTSGTASFCNTNYKLYPGVRVNSVLDTATNQVDGTMNTMPSPVAFANGDTVMQPHYPWIYTAHDGGRGVNQFIPRMYNGGALYGLTYNYLLSGTPFIGFQISNATDQNRYLGYGGTHIPPGTGFDLGGEWSDSFVVNHAPGNAVIRVGGCKPDPIGCNNINSNFNVLLMPNGNQALNYDPRSLTWTFGSNYAPQNNPQIASSGTVQAYNLHALHTVTAPQLGVGGRYLFNAGGNVGVTNTPDSPAFNAPYANYAYGFGPNNGNAVDGFLYHGASVDSINCGTGTGDTSCTFALGVLNAGTAVNAPSISASASVTTPSLTVGGGSAVTHVAFYSTGSITPTAVPAESCSDQSFTISGLTAADHLGEIAPPGALGNLSLTGYAAGDSSLTLHICNVSTASATPPPGAYTFLAMH